MITLINGRGQLGDKLLQAIEGDNTEKDVRIYHTWNIDDKSKSIQKREYEKFVNFLKREPEDNKIVFISTNSQKDSWYVYYKHLSEAFLLTNREKCVIIRLPTLIGKGVFPLLKSGELQPEDFFNLISIDKAVKIILEKTKNNNIVKSFHVIGETISAESVKNILCL
tara:strand:- start:263 stop:763 length:501 start_codon:yes stop_codon:yes gene_type:complete